MSPEEFIYGLDTLGYVIAKDSCPAEPSSSSNDLCWTKFEELSRYLYVKRLLKVLAGS